MCKQNISFFLFWYEEIILLYIGFFFTLNFSIYSFICSLLYLHYFNFIFIPPG